MGIDMVPFKRKAFNQGGSISFTIPPELLEWIELTEGAEICLAGDKSKHGKYIAIWNPHQQNPSKQKKMDGE